jgi:hypothetical protein
MYIKLTVFVILLQLRNSTCHIGKVRVRAHEEGTARDVLSTVLNPNLKKFKLISNRHS